MSACTWAACTPPVCSFFDWSHVFQVHTCNVGLICLERCTFCNFPYLSHPHAGTVEYIRLFFFVCSRLVGRLLFSPLSTVLCCRLTVSPHIFFSLAQCTVAASFLLIRASTLSYRPITSTSSTNDFEFLAHMDGSPSHGSCSYWLLPRDILLV
jgi:hypothetical protein